MEIARSRVVEVRADFHRKWNAEIEILSAPPSASSAPPQRVESVPTIRELRDVAYKLAFESSYQRLDTLMKALKGKPISEWNGFVQRQQDRLTEANRRLALCDYAAYGPLLAGLSRLYRWKLEPDSAEYAYACEQFAKAHSDSWFLIAEKSGGNLDAAPRTDIVREVQAERSRTVPAGKRLLDLYDTYADRILREGKNRTDTIVQGRKMVEVFSNFIGTDRDPNTITGSDVAEFRDVLASLPASFRKRNDFKNLSLSDAQKRAAELGLKEMSLANVNKYLSNISPLFAWAKQDRRITIDNPVDGLHFDAKSNRKTRRPFLVEEINDILASPLFTGFLGNKQEHVAGDQHAEDWRFWIPIACIFTGSRISEIAQLQVQDVRCDYGIWYFDIVEDEESERKVKNRKCRVVPIHETLIQLGFVRFHATQAKRAAADGNPLLFSGLKPDSRGFIGNTPGRFFRGYLGKIGVKDGADGLGPHTFRHTLADEFRMAGFMDAEFGPLILGHSSISVTGRYGRLPEGTLKARNNLIQALKFEGIDFDNLITKRADANLADAVSSRIAPEI
jgi:integrase